MKSLFAVGDSSGMRDAAVLHHLRPPRSRGSIDTFAASHPHRAHVINTVDAVMVSKSFVYKDWSNAAAFAAHHGRIPPGEGH